MFKIIKERLNQGYRTFDYPNKKPELSERFRGLPEIDQTVCAEYPFCRDCIEACPYGVISKEEKGIALDIGKCIFCGDCVSACKLEVLKFSKDYRLASNNREDLIFHGEKHNLAAPLGENLRKIFGRSLKLRQVSAGGCNACEADLNVLNTLVFDLGRFGIQFVASPRHADGLIITGPVTENMKSALIDTYNALAEPKIVIASGSCTISGGPFFNSNEVNAGVGNLIPVDLYIPGCPPHPYTVLDGLLKILGRNS